MRFFLFFQLAWSIFLCNTLFAQLDDIEHIELDPIKSTDEYYVEALWDRAVLFHESREKSESTIYAKVFDVNLKQIDKQILPLNYKYKEGGSVHGDQYAVVVLSPRKRKDPFAVVAYDYTKGKFKSVYFEVENQQRVPAIKTFTMKGNKLAIVFQSVMGFGKSASDFVVFDVNQGKIVFQKELYSKKSEPKGYVQTIKYDAAWSSFIISATEESSGNTHQRLHIFKANQLGLYSTLLIKKPDDDKKHDLVSSRLYGISPKDAIIIGTYGQGYRTGGSAFGMYFAKVKSQESVTPKLISFGEFNDFYRYLQELRPKSNIAERKEEKAERRLEKGKEIRERYLLDVRHIYQQNDNYIIVCEAYFPVYITQTTTGPNGTTTTTQVFIGFRYSHAMVAAFDINGKLQWNHSFPIWDILIPQIRPQTAITSMDESNLFTLAYNARGRVHLEKVRNGEVVTEKNDQSLDLREDNKKFIRSWDVYSEHWYENTFIMYGMMKGDRDGGILRPSKFYIAKVKP